jgi:hypothetical protein
VRQLEPHAEHRYQHLIGRVELILEGVLPPNVLRAVLGIGPHRLPRRETVLGGPSGSSGVWPALQGSRKIGSELFARYSPLVVDSSSRLQGFLPDRDSRSTCMDGGDLRELSPRTWRSAPTPEHAYRESNRRASRGASGAAEAKPGRARTARRAARAVRGGELRGRRSGPCLRSWCRACASGIGRASPRGSGPRSPADSARRLL